MNYFYSTLSEYESVLGDVELNDLVHDLVKVFHDKEWWDSADIGEGSYNKTVKEFKDKWFTDAGALRRYDGYIDEAITKLRRELRLDKKYCHDCRNWAIEAGYSGEYGNCFKYKTCLVHGYDRPCEDFETRE